jgi:putative intracellular protease/amidase
MHACSQVTGFTNEEEEGVGKHEAVPFLLEEKLKERGADYRKWDAFTPYAMTDKRVITGQNPQSSKKVASMIIEALERSR